VLRLIREQEPPTPSSRLSSSEAEPTVAANRQMEPQKLGRFVKGELDWVVMKALSKERDRRYDSPGAFARDVERFLAHEPAAAGPPSASYRFRKFVRRNRATVTAASLVLLALLLGMAGTTAGMIRAERARAAEAEQRGIAEAREREANDEKSRAVEAADHERKAKEAEKSASLKEAEERGYAEAIAAFVKDDFLALTSLEGQYRFAGSDRVALDPNLTLKQMLDRAAHKLDARKDLAPRIEADLRWMIGVNCRGQGEYAKAVRHLERCVELWRQLLGADHDDTLDAQNSLAVAYEKAGKPDKAVPLLEQALELTKAKLGPDHPDTLTIVAELGQAYCEANQGEKAVPLLKQFVAAQRKRIPEGHPDLAALLAQVSLDLLGCDQFAAAEPMLRESLAIREKKQPDAWTTFNARSMLGGPCWGRRSTPMPSRCCSRATRA
jgi:tetratricopeptide (TPR) repeat protein